MTVGTINGFPFCTGLANAPGIAVNAAGVFIVGSGGGGGSLSVVRQVFTTTGTYTPTANMVFCNIEVVGGGGGGGGCTIAGSSQGNGSGGGGGGGYAAGIFSAATIGVSQSVTIGAAGTGGASGGNNGSTGGTTSVGVLISATGGTGGIAALGVGTGEGGNGGSGGSGTGGDFQTTGSPGGFGCSFESGGGGYGSSGGVGGSSYFGGGATGLANNSSANGNTASSYGGGGGGASDVNAGSPRAGGDGFIGAVIVTEYVQAGGGGGGGVTGPGSSTNNGIATWNGTTGTALLSPASPVISAGGIVTNSNQPAFHAYIASTTGSVTGDGTLVTVPYDSVSFDQGTNFNTGANEYVCPVAGLYQYNVNLGTIVGSAGTNSYYIARLIVNGSTTYSFNSGNPYLGVSGATQQWINGSILIHNAASDTVQIQVAVGGNGSPNIQLNGGVGNNTFSGFLVC